MRAQQGFTLIEIVVAVSLLALLGVLGYRGLEATTRQAARLGEQAARWQEIDLVLARIAGDVRQAVVLPGIDGWRQTRQPAQLSLNSIADDGAALRRSTYRWQGQQLELLAWPAFDAAAPGPARRLLDGVASLELASLDAGNQWREAWPPTAGAGLPRALRLRLTLAEGGVIERIFDVAAAD